MAHSSSSTPPVDQSTPRNWDESTDLDSSTQTSVHIYHGLEDGKKLNSCIAEQTGSIYNICQSQLEIHNTKSVSQHYVGA